MEIELFARVAGLAGLSVLAVEEILKLKVIPLSFANRYPVVTNILLSVIAALVAVWQGHLNPNHWTDWVVLVATIAVVAAITYNQLIGKSPELKSMEG